MYIYIYLYLSVSTTFAVAVNLYNVEIHQFFLILGLNVSF